MWYDLVANTPNPEYVTTNLPCWFICKRLPSASRIYQLCIALGFQFRIYATASLTVVKLANVLYSPLVCLITRTSCVRLVIVVPFKNGIFSYVAGIVNLLTVQVSLFTQFDFSCRCLLVQLQVSLLTCSTSGVVVYLFNFKCRC